MNRYLHPLSIARIEPPNSRALKAPLLVQPTGSLTVNTLHRINTASSRTTPTMLDHVSISHESKFFPDRLTKY
jgi:hypothetical protein